MGHGKQVSPRKMSGRATRGSGWPGCRAKASGTCGVREGGRAVSGLSAGSERPTGRKGGSRSKPPAPLLTKEPPRAACRDAVGLGSAD